MKKDNQSLSLSPAPSSSSSVPPLYQSIYPPDLSYSNLEKSLVDSDLSSDDEDYDDKSQLRATHSFNSNNNNDNNNNEDEYNEDSDSDLELGLNRTAKRTRKNKKKYIIIGLAGVVTFVLILSLLFSGDSSDAGDNDAESAEKDSGLFSFGAEAGNKKASISMDMVFNNTFTPEIRSIDWLPEAGDGVYSEKLKDGSINLVDLSQNTSQILVNASNVLDQYGRRLNWDKFQVSSDLGLIWFSTDEEQRWRHSNRFNVFIHNVSSHETYPVTDTSYPPKILLSKWAPQGQSLVYVQNNDIYFVPSPSPNAKPVRLTNIGSDTIFCGTPDWVYEEEVLASDTALWWSPDGSKLAYLTFDDTNVPVYEFDIYNPSHSVPGALPYPQKYSLRYPKPGFNNPIVSLNIFDIQRYLQSHSNHREGEQEQEQEQEQDNNQDKLNPIVIASTYKLNLDNRLKPNDQIFVDLAWADATNLIIKQSNRVSNHMLVTYFDLSANGEYHDGTLHGTVVRDIDYNQIDGGWYEPEQSIYPLASNDTDSSKGYLDLLPNDDGFKHLAYFPTFNATNPIFLTSGPWEIDGTIKAVDTSSTPTTRVYFMAANPSTQRHLYAIDIPTNIDNNVNAKQVEAPLTTLTDISKEAYYEVSFSHQAQFFLLTNLGPGVPQQFIYNVNDMDKPQLINDNKNLSQVLSSVDLPPSQTSVLHVDEDRQFNMLEIYPPNFDPSGRVKYPVLFRPYGGPNSQTASSKFAIDWHYHLASERKYIIVAVDGRGTGYRGRKFRSPIHNKLGDLEAIDQIDAANEYSKRSYVDSSRMGIWGWSFGGYLTGKVLERNSGVFSLGMSVAPVTDWRLYDSIYTERYMGVPEVNGHGYDKTSIKNMDGFRNTSYLLAHGSGDDNVHYENSAALLDRFTMAKVRNFEFRMFTDSNHRINTRGAYRELHEFLESFLTRHWRKENKYKF